MRPSLRSIGPAIVVAAVVCGPGSILTASEDRRDLRLHDDLDAGARRAADDRHGLRRGAVGGDDCGGRPATSSRGTSGAGVAFTVGFVVFLIAGGFQTSNNLAVMKAIAPHLEPGLGKWVPPAAAIALNAALIAIVYRSRSLYTPVERAMKVLVGLMIIAFLANCFAVRPSLAAAAGGLVPEDA